MAHDIDEALKYLLEEEGGWSDNPNDKGGKTMFGVIQTTYTAYRDRKGLPNQTVRNITKAEAREIYEHDYWNAAGCDRLPWPISYLTFDAAVNSGVSRASKWTQAGLGVQPDGVIGANTVATANAAIDNGDSSVVLNIVDQRVQFLAGLVKAKPSQQTFLLGWWRRTLRVLGRALLSDLS